MTARPLTFRTIVADPPWAYDGFASAPTIRRQAQGVRVKPLPYASMTLDEIRALPVGDLAAVDARLFLWTTSKYLPDAFSVVEAWGFEYRQTLVWRKTGNPSPFGGSVAPQHAEFLLVAVKGSPRVADRLKGSVIEAPAAAPGKAPGGKRSHSAKPDVFLDHIEKISPGPYVELFARRARLGWNTWGDQAPGGLDLMAPTVASASSPEARWCTCGRQPVRSELNDPSEGHCWDPSSCPSFGASQEPGAGS